MTLPHDILPGIKSRSDGTSRKDSRRDSKKGWRPRPVVFHHSFEAANAFGGNTPGPLGAGVASHPKTPDRLPLGPYPYRRQCDECSPRSSSADYLGPKWGRGGAFPLSTNPRPWSNKTGRRSPSRSHAPPSPANPRHARLGQHTTLLREAALDASTEMSASPPVRTCVASERVRYWFLNATAKVPKCNNWTHRLQNRSSLMPHARERHDELPQEGLNRNRYFDNDENKPGGSIPPGQNRASRNRPRLNGMPSRFPA